MSGANQPVAEIKPDEIEAPDEDDDKKKASKEKKHDSGSADLEKVTDYQEEKELSHKASASAVQLLDSEREKLAQRKKELAKVVIKKEDVDLIVEELEISKLLAEKKLREHRGNLKEALRELIAV